MNDRQVTFQPQGGTVSDTVLTAVASVKQVDKLQLPPLHDALDVDALDALFDSRADGIERTSAGTIGFRYAGYEVRVKSDDAVTICQPY